MSLVLHTAISLAVFFLVSPNEVLARDQLDKCKEFTKYGLPSNKGDLLCRKGFALAHNSERKTPDWVAEHLTKKKASARTGRKNYFAPDPDLKPGRRAELTDYEGEPFDRGHMAPAADMSWNIKAYKECFYLSNMAPQVGPGMNRSIWRALESRVRRWAILHDDLYVYTGPIYKRNASPKSIGDNEVGVPTHFYKIVFDPRRNRAIAFVMPNKALKTKDMPKYIVTIDEVEKRTGLNFLSTLSTARQSRIEARKEIDLWQYGHG